MTALLVCHVEHGRDRDLVELASRLGSCHDVILVNVRPSPASATSLPPSMLMSDLGVMMFEDWRRACAEDESVVNARIAARSAMLRAAGIEHSVETVTYHRSLFSGRTRRNVQRAVARIADRVRADEIVVGPGATLGCRGPDPNPPGKGVAVLAAAHDDETRRLLDDLWIDLGGSD